MECLMSAPTVISNCNTIYQRLLCENFKLIHLDELTCCQIDSGALQHTDVLNCRDWCSKHAHSTVRTYIVPHPLPEFKAACPVSRIDLHLLACGVFMHLQRFHPAQF
jgi:hypothetical protein